LAWLGLALCTHYLTIALHGSQT